MKIGQIHIFCEYTVQSIRIHQSNIYTKIASYLICENIPFVRYSQLTPKNNVSRPSVFA